VRRFVLIGVAMAVALGGVAWAVAASGQSTGPVRSAAAASALTWARSPRLTRSVGKAERFLNQMMDLRATGSTPRLVQSFTGGVLGSQNFTDSETYDDALIIDAYLARRTRGALSRAEIIGNGLLYVQANDVAHDGRIRAAYAPTPLASPSDVQVTDSATAVGNMAWAGQALVQLYAATGTKAYLAGAEAIGTWIQANSYDTRGAGGYTGGVTAAGQKIEWKSTEHNIDVYAFFRLLARETGNAAWSARAAWARRFVVAMWDGRDGRFYVGTTVDGTTVNSSQTPEDVNSWSYLAFRDPAYAASVSWDVRNLAVSAGGFSGVSFCQGDRSGVWFEGTAHLADALEFRGAPAEAATYLRDIAYAQANGPNGDGLGIIAASKDKLSDCDGDYYYASLHTGTTAWYILAAQRIDPFFKIPAS
jgi:hypothetical protein